MIQSLADLKTDVVFAKLITAQQQLEKDDPVLSAMPMTRSSHHVFSYLVAWALILPDGREEVVNKLNANFQNGPLFTRQELDTLVTQLDWDKLFTTFPRDGETPFFTLELNEDVYDTIMDVKNHTNSLYKALVQHKLIARSSQLDTVTFTTQVKQRTQWLDSFTIADDKNLWQIPSKTFQLSPSFIQELDSMRDDCLTKGKITKQLGAFTVTAERREDYGHDKNVYYVYINNQGKKKLSVEVPEADINPGLYNSFVGASLVGRDFRVGKVKVKLKGSASFDQFGCEASQRQKVLYASLCSVGNECTYVAYSIIVKDVYAHFQEADVIANFSSPAIATKEAGLVQKIELKDTKRATTVVLLSQYPTNKSKLALAPSDVIASPSTDVSPSFLLQVFAHSAIKLAAAALILLGIFGLTATGLGLIGATVGLTASVGAVTIGSTLSACGFYASSKIKSEETIEAPKPEQTLSFE